MFNIESFNKFQQAGYPTTSGRFRMAQDVMSSEKDISKAYTKEEEGAKIGGLLGAVGGGLGYALLASNPVGWGFGLAAGAGSLALSHLGRRKSAAGAMINPFDWGGKGGALDATRDKVKFGMDKIDTLEGDIFKTQIADAIKYGATATSLAGGPLESEGLLQAINKSGAGSTASNFMLLNSPKKMQNLYQMTGQSLWSNPDVFIP